MTFNIRHARGMDGVVDVERVAEVIREASPDLVGLQEVDQGVARTDGRDLPRELAELTRMKACFGPNITYDGGLYGNAVLTRLPVIREENVSFPQIHPDEQRGAIHVVVEVGGNSLLFVNGHLDFRPEDDERLLSLERLRQVRSGYGRMPVIVCGDFNAFPDGGTIARMKQDFLDLWELGGTGEGLTFPSDDPNRRIDYIFWEKGFAVEVTGAWVPLTDASDHRPLVVEMRVGFTSTV
jgi:endonuclease/exonuclease/phosphatase family metal-dependent hydrolase